MTDLTGHTNGRAYLDWNASAPLRPEARDAMVRAMDEIGNPSSVHAEGRKAKAIVERARAQVADLVGCDSAEVVFTSGATEAASAALAGRDIVVASKADHDCLWENASKSVFIEVGGDGAVYLDDSFDVECLCFVHDDDAVAVSSAQSETGVMHDLQHNLSYARERLPEGVALVVDAVQTLGKAKFRFGDILADFALVSGHKIGGPKGVGALIVNGASMPSAHIKGGGQEQNRRAGTENVFGIAGFGAAAEAAKRDLEAGAWDEVAERRNNLETTLKDAAPDLLIIGANAPRLPNTSCVAIPGWKGETQVMQMDLSGYAISAGSACSSGKVNRASRALLAMGYDEITASSAIRVSIGPTTTAAELQGFANAWITAYQRWKAKAA